MTPLTPILLRAADVLLNNGEYIGVVHGPDQRPLRLAARGTRKNTVALCLWATHNIIATVPLRDVLLPAPFAQRLAAVACQQTRKEPT